MCPRFLSLVVLALSLFGAAAPASSQVIWQDGRPIFQSDKRTYRFQSDKRTYRARPARPVIRQFPRLMSGGPRPFIEPQEPATIAVPNNEPIGTVIIDTDARALYLVRSNRSAYRYPISVGREGFTWTGTEKVSRIADWPDWHPPKDMRQRQPELPEKMTGGIRNPLGAKAIYLGNSLYRIHGTNDASTIGQAASSGCFRMLNGHVVHLADLVQVGTTVKVVHHWKAGVARTTAGKQRPGNG